MKKKKIYIICLLILMGIQVQAQKEIYNWTFGFGAGLTWNTTRSMAVTGLLGTPDTIINNLPDYFESNISSIEGCISLSNSRGKFLFYSNGTRLLDRNGNVMPNGLNLTGNTSAAQTGIFLPYPGNRSWFVAVLLGAGGASNLSYSIIDIKLNSGLGDIIPSKKNIRFENASGVTGESLTSVLHANGIDYWIIAPGKGSSSYLNAWLLTKDGISSAPIVTDLPVSVYSDSSNGYFKLTYDGRHFVYATFTDNKVFYGDFDSSTGKFSNIRTILDIVEPYGVEFSPSQEFLYLTNHINTNIRIYKMDDLFGTTDPTTVKPKLLENPLPNVKTFIGALQIGPDKRMYLATPNLQGGTMLFIDNPNDPDHLRIYSVSSFIRGNCNSGLPPFVSSWFLGGANGKPFVCAGNTFKYNINVSFTNRPDDNPVRLEWDFGDQSPVVSQTITAGITDYKQYHQYEAEGEYTIITTPYRADGVPLLPAIRQLVTVEDCVFQVNRSIRVNLLNEAKKYSN